MTTHASLSCTDLSVGVGGRVLATHVDLVVRPGELHAVMGASGSGKSTLLWTVAGLLRGRGGTVEIVGERVRAERPREAAALRRRHVGIVYQQPNLIAELSVVENVAVPLAMTRGLSRPEAERRAADALGELGIDTSTATSHLSGGEQQRVSVARATIGGPTLILADEPTAALDETSATRVMDTLIEQCRSRDCALLMVTHDSRIAARAHARWVLTEGGLTGDDA